jgi:hypothetical protein
MEIRKSGLPRNGADSLPAGNFAGIFRSRGVCPGKFALQFHGRCTDFPHGGARNFLVTQGIHSLRRGNVLLPARVWDPPGIWLPALTQINPKGRSDVDVLAGGRS